ncbi:MAG: DNA mismatch repair endonuclease MutL [Nitrospiraceae bacterium]|nr:MAG: DNA mismatch repair endonuclease MutL [Nitrospiraceae bacterium]
MSKITVLPDILINKIAAGEVIERPASIVRELIDNSIDAGATKIDVEILHGGKKLIKVSDNGSGMDRDDAILCFKRHATSKIKSEEDLFDITSLGFRGEALAAIAAVSKIMLTTCSDGSDAGTRIEIGANRKEDISDAPPAQGTTVEVRDIFYNTPARRKFLKSNPTELSHIIETVVQKAFACPGISFSLVHNSSELLDVSAASDLKERFSQLYGEEFKDQFLSSTKEARGIRVYGFFSKADFTRAGKGHQYIFVNNRPVKNPTVNHAVYRGYSNIIPRDRHPAYFIFLDIDHGKVDVNVHPAKREVRFEAPDEIHRAVEAAVYEALNPATRKEPDHIPYQEKTAPGMPAGFYYIPDSPAVAESAPEMYHNLQTDFFTSGMTPDVTSFFHIGESFFATVTGDGLLIIDQHAAHERILYEKFLCKTSLETDPLFLPLRIELPLREYHLVVGYKDFLRGLGLDVEGFGGNNVIVRSLPGELTKADIKGLLMDIAAGIIEEETSGIKGDTPGESLLKNIASRLACHKSVRGSEKLANEELTKMMSDLDRTAEPDRCPHGRPTRILLSLDDLKKMFKRK